MPGAPPPCAGRLPRPPHRGFSSRTPTRVVDCPGASHVYASGHPPNPPKGIRKEHHTMQTWAKRGLQTALVTGGLLMLGTGIASADEDVNPDRPASPLDGSVRVPVHFDNNALGTPLGQKNLPSIDKELRVSVRRPDRRRAAGAARPPRPLAPIAGKAKDAAGPVVGKVTDQANPTLDKVTQQAQPAAGQGRRRWPTRSAPTTAKAGRAPAAAAAGSSACRTSTARSRATGSTATWSHRSTSPATRSRCSARPRWRTTPTSPMRTPRPS